MGTQLRYAFRVYPTVPQRVRAARLFGCCRVVFNDAVAARRRAHAEGLPYPRSAELSRRLITEAKRTEERAWLSEVSSVPLQQALRDVDAAYSHFFASIKGKRKGRRMGPPQFKKRSHRQAARFTRNAGFKILGDGRLRLPKIGELKVAWSRRLPAEPSSVTLLRERSGKYFVSFVVTVDGDDALVPVDDETGVDLGLKSFAVMRGGRLIENPRYFKRMERRIAKAQRAMARKVKGSANREKARIRVAKLHETTANRRKDFIEQVSTRIIAENQRVFVESLPVSGLSKGRSAKSVQDAAWGRFMRTLEDKCVRYGRDFVAIDRWFPSTRLCSVCGALTGPKGQAELEVRKWACPCGAKHSRDANAEINIRREGRRLLDERNKLAEGRSSSDSGAKPESRNDCGGNEDLHPG